MKSAALIPAVLALAVAAAGCGGSGGDSGGGSTSTTASSMTKQQFAAKVTRVCTKWKKKIAKVDLSIGSAGSVANSGQEVADLENDLLDELKSLQPPEEVKSQFEDFVSKTQTARDKLVSLVHAAKNFQTENVAKMTSEVTSAGADAHAAAKSFGATC